MTLHFVTALACESRPLRRALGLVAASERHPFPVFRGEGVALVVTGVGRTSAAAGTAYLGALTGASRCDPWVNVGVGGHRDLPLGEALVAHAIRDARSGRSWYPPRTATESLPSARVLTVDEPETAYREDAVYEMEAAGFWPIANRFGSAELVQSLKVISDGPRAPAAAMEAGGVEGLIEDALPRIRALADGLRTLAGQGPPPAPDAGPWLRRWRFTVTQRHELEDLLRRWTALEGDPRALLAAAAEATDGREVLAGLRRHIDASGRRTWSRPTSKGGT